MFDRTGISLFVNLRIGEGMNAFAVDLVSMLWTLADEKNLGDQNKFLPEFQNCPTWPTRPSRSRVDSCSSCWNTLVITVVDVVPLLIRCVQICFVSPFVYFGPPTKTVSGAPGGNNFFWQVVCRVYFLLLAGCVHIKESRQTVSDVCELFAGLLLRKDNCSNEQSESKHHHDDAVSRHFWHGFSRSRWAFWCTDVDANQMFKQLQLLRRVEVIYSPLDLCKLRHVHPASNIFVVIRFVVVRVL